MLKIAICDDEVQQLERTYELVLAFTKAKPDLDFSVRRFQSAYDLLECIEMTNGFHIYLLDIIMPVLNGIDVGNKIREKDENAVLIYLTSSPDYALKSYGVSAFHYLLKPIEREELYRTFEKARVKLDLESAKSLLVKAKDGIVALAHQRILYAEYTDHCVKFCLSDGSVLASVTSREPFDSTVSEIMKDSRFLRPNVSFVVNMSAIRTITNKDLVMANGSLIPISRKSYAKVKKQFIDCVLEG